MNFIKKAVAVFLVGCIAGPASVYAEGVYDVSYDLETAKVTVKGNTETPLCNVTLQILKAGKTVENLENLRAEDADEVVSRYDQVTSDENGDFIFNFPLSDDMGSDTYVAAVSWGGKMNDSTFVYISQTDFKNALNEVNSAANAAEMADAIERNAKYFGIDISDYNTLTESEKALIADAVISGRGSGYDTSAFVSTFREALVIQLVNHGNKALDIMTRYDEVLRLSELTSYATFVNQKDVTKNDIMQAVSNAGPYSSIEGIQNSFEDKTVIYSLYATEGYDGVYPILKDNNHILNIDFSDYESLKYKSNVDKKMNESLFASAQAVAAAFNTYVADEKKKESTSGSGSSSGGGGGGGGGASSVKPTIIVNNTVNEVQISSDGTSGQGMSVPRFTDLNGVDWAKESIDRLAANGIISGRGDNKFDPTSYVTREEFAKMLVSALDIYEENAVCAFDDTDSDEWFYGYVASGVKAGLIQGFNERIFGTGANISREDMSLMLYRAALLKGMKFETAGGSAFIDDDKIADYAAESVRALYSKGIVTGNDNGMFEPKKNATRAETAVMLDRFLGVIQ
ncbi:MAG: S-layer homology domain-containing protein [Candidatus Ornithomonoglobus sp.]